MISAIILAAGQSTRMGFPKMLLPWGRTTVIEHIISIFEKAGIDDILVITGGAHLQLEGIILECGKRHPVRSVYNEDYLNGEMLSSIQCGLQHLGDKSIGAAIIGLGDQPQVQASSVRSLREAFLQTRHPLIVPSYQGRRGHPWLLARPLWDELIAMSNGQTPRDFLNNHSKDIQYINMDTPTILKDIDTPEDYRAAHP